MAAGAIVGDCVGVGIGAGVAWNSFPQSEAGAYAPTRRSTSVVVNMQSPFVAATSIIAQRVEAAVSHHWEPMKSQNVVGRDTCRTVQVVPGSLGRGKTDGTSLRVQLVHSHPDETVMASRLGVSARRREGSWCRRSASGGRGER